MCFVIEKKNGNKIFHKARSEKRVYKILIKYADGTYATPFQFCLVEKGAYLRGKYDMLANISVSKLNEIYKDAEKITDGFVHAYENCFKASF